MTETTMILQFWGVFSLVLCLRVGYALTTPSRSIRVHEFGPYTNSNMILRMALTPVGPFCPFRSSTAMELEPMMDQWQSSSPSFATEMQKIQLDMQLGKTPDPERLTKVAKDMESAVGDWERLMFRLRQSRDFQTREYAKLTQAHLSTHGVTIECIVSMMRWQAGCMRAMASNQAPPLPPQDLDLEKMMKDAQESVENGTPAPSMTAMQAAESITANPFDPDSFTSDTVKEEYGELVRDHSALIEFGTRYADFDPLGKVAFLNEVEKIEERWDIFFLRFNLMGAIDETYKQQCDDFLESMNLTEHQYRDLLKKCHDLMRKDAEQERGSMPQ